jgi:hypothetical protein
MFSYLINLVYSNSIFPNKLKIAHIFLKYKAGNKNIITNYRPITNINILAKIIEKNMLLRIKSFINFNNLIHSNQFAYQKQKSINNALIKKTNFIFNALNNSKMALAIYLDLTRAFETVCHPLLLTKLHNFGFNSKSLLLLENYLSNRIQYTVINKSISTPNKIITGLPQGTILAPWLFILFFNDIFLISHTGLTIAFADDIVLLYEIDKNANELLMNVNNSINDFSSWFKNNLL